MRSLIAAAAALSMVSGAFAADMPVLKAPAPLATINASGFYIGVMGAGSKVRSDFEFVALPGDGSLRPAGFVAGAVLGAGVWSGATYFGVEADVGYTWAKDDQPCGFVQECTTRPSWFGTQRVVIGATLPGLMGQAVKAGASSPSQWPIPLNVPASLSTATLMPYITGGVAERRIEACVTLQGCGKEWLIGWTAGAGFKLPLSSAFSLDFTYLYINWNKNFIPASAAVIFPATFKAQTEQMLRMAFTYHL